MPERAIVSSVFDMSGGAEHHIFEINPLIKTFLVVTENDLEDLEEGVRALAQFQGHRFLCAVVDLVSAILEVAQEGSDQRREAVDHANLCDLVVDLDVGDWSPSDVWLQFLGQGIEQPPFLSLPTVSFDQNRLMFGMNLTFPFYARQILVSIDKRGRGQFLGAVR